MGVYFGGYDPAKRVDAAAFVILEHDKGILTQIGQKTWNKINYKTQADDLLKIQQRYPMTKLCYDRTGVGDAAVELFSTRVPMEEVISSLPQKIEIINFLHSLFHNKRLIIKDADLYEQVLEQEKYISEAGNELYRHPASSHDDVFWALGYACLAAKGLMMGKPTYSMSRKDREMKQNLHPVDQDILNDLGPGWQVQSA